MDNVVYGIIVNYNNFKDLELAINSFKKQLYPNLEIVVVDNGSNKNFLEQIKGVDGIILLQNEENLGWASANNKGIKYALSMGADYIILANNDIFFDNDNLVAELLNDFKRFGDSSPVKIIGPTNKYFHDKERIINQGIILFENKHNPFNGYRLDFCRKNRVAEQFVSVDSVHGCFMMLKAEVFEEVGLFDEDFFFYYDEIDFSYRAWKKGIASLVNKELSVYHKVSLTAVEKSPFQMYYLTRNQIYFVKKFTQEIAWKFKLTLFRSHCINIANVIFRKKKRNYQGSKLSLLRFLIKGMFHGYSSKLGKRIR